jgi:hypothetical protein
VDLHPGTGSFSSGASMPEGRGRGAGRVARGEGGCITSAEAWTELADMPTARDGIQALVRHGRVFVAAGGISAGGGDPTDVCDVFPLPDL